VRIEIPTSGLHLLDRRRAYKWVQLWIASVDRLYRDAKPGDSSYSEILAENGRVEIKALGATRSVALPAKLVAAGDCPQFARHEVVRRPWPGNRHVAILEVPRRRAITVLILGN